MVDPNELALLLLNYSKDPTPIQNFQSWSTEFGPDRSRFELQERERDIRRNRTQQRSKEGFLEVLIVVGVLAMIFIPFLVWLYYKSGVCESSHDERTLQRRTSHGLTPESSEAHPRETYYTPPSDSLKGIRMPSPHPHARSQSPRDIVTPRTRHLHHAISMPEPRRDFKPTPIKTTKIEYESPFESPFESPLSTPPPLTRKAVRDVRDVGMYAYREGRDRERDRTMMKGKVFV